VATRGEIGRFVRKKKGGKKNEKKMQIRDLQLYCTGEFNALIYRRPSPKDEKITTKLRGARDRKLIKILW
jgi:hypothetical protein